MIGTRIRRIGAVLALLSPVGLLVHQQPVHAATIIVTTTVDEVTNNGQTSLREAIIAANATSTADVIEIPAGNYALTICGSGEDLAATGDLDLREDVTLRGPAVGTATIQQTCDDRVIDALIAPTVVIERLTITGGAGQAGFDHGGGIALRFGGSLTVRDSTITGNSAGSGGAGDAASGGGVYVDNSGTLLIERSTITNNSVGSGGDAGAGPAVGWKAGGGGVAFRGFSSTPGTVTIVDTTISGNTGGVAGRGGGGGVWLDALDVTLTNVDVIDNSIPGDTTGRASGNGAGIAITPINPADRVLDVTITGGEISANTIGTPTGIAVPGGGVFGGNGGGLYVEADGGSLTVDGTTFDGNQAGDGGAQVSGVGGGGSGGNLYVSAFTSSSIVPLGVTIADAEIVDGVAGDSSGGPGGNGGGAFVLTGSSALGSTIDVSGTSFAGNTGGSGTAGGAGGGLYARSTTGTTAGSITVTDSTFDGNAAGDGIDVPSGDGGSGGAGGGVWLFIDGPAAGDPLVTVDATTVVRNRAGHGGDSTSGTGGFAGRGGGALVVAADAVVTGSTFTDNDSGDGGSGATGRAGGDGGGLHVIADDVTVTTTTFTANETGDGGAGSGGSGSSGGDGGGAFLDLVEPPLIQTTDFGANTTGAGGSGTTTAGSGGFGGGAALELGPHSEPATFVDVAATGNTTGDGGDSPTGNAGSGGFGGAFSIRGANSPVALDRVEIIDNRTGDAGSGVTAASAFGGSGGGVWLTDNTTGGGLLVEDSAISDNTTGSGGNASQANAAGGLGGSGGGLSVALGAGGSGAGDISIERSSITGNVTGNGGAAGPGGSNPVGGSGAGAHLATGSSGEVSLGNSTVSANRTGPASGGFPKGDGGGLFVAAPTGLLTLTHVTMGGNDAHNGVAILSGAASVAIDRTVIADSVRVGNNPADNCNFTSGTQTSGGYNVETNGDTCDFDAASDIRNFTGETLAPLADNGGPGLTQVPLITTSASVVVDRIPTPDCTRVVDQRGVSRPSGGGCDVGAIESQPTIIAVDDVIEVSGTSTDIVFVANDIVTEASLDHVRVTLPRQPADGTLLVDEGGDWRFVSPQQSGAFTDFEYQVCLGATDICDTATVTLIPAGSSRFVSLQPARVFDTRPETSAPGPKGTIPAGGTIDVQITGVAGIPSSGVSAVALNVTAARIGEAGFVTAFPTGSARPNTSNLNVPGPGATVPNMVIVPVGAGGRVSFYSFGSANLIADVAGYFTEQGVSTDAASAGTRAGRLVPIAPTRVFDNRPITEAPGPKGLVAAGDTIDVQIAGRAGVPTSGVTSVVMNLTWTQTQGRGFVTAFPTGTALPTASNLNATGSGQTVANLVIVPLGQNGKISLFTDVGGYLLGDVTGYITDDTAPRSLDGLFAPIAPDRVFDTRPGTDAPGPKGFVAANGTITGAYSGVAGVPRSGVGAVVTNVTAVRSAAPGFITVWPDGLTRPTASTLNLSSAGETRPNAAVLPLGTGGRLQYYSFPGSHLLADAFGWFLG